MKKNLFLLVVGLLSSVMSFAQPEGWVDPTTNFTKTSTIVDGVEYYLYNVEADAWFAGGNNWWTAAVVYKTGDPNLSADGMEHGFKFKLTDKQNDGAYHINQFYGPNGKLASVNNKWFFLTDRADGVFFTDNGSGDTYWTFIPDNDGNFQIKSSKGDFKANSVGLVSQDGINPYFTTDDGKEARTGESDQTGGATMTNKNAVCTTWALYCYGAPEAVLEWDAVKVLWDRINEIYDETEEAFDVSTYNDQIGEQKGTLENAERLKALLATLNANYLIWKFNKGGQVPVDVALVNPSFEDNFNGWTNSGMATQGNDAFALKDGTKYAEAWQPQGTKSVSQKVSNLPGGMYKLSAGILARGITSAKISAAGSDLELPIVDAASKQSLVFTLEEAGDVTVLYEATGTGASNSWIAVDNFKLKYLGSGGIGLANTFEETYKDKASYCYQQGLQEKLNILKAATTQEAIDEAYADALNYEATEIAENIAMWDKYNELVRQCQALIDEGVEGTANLQAMLQQKLTIKNAETDPTTEKLNTYEISGYNVMRAEFDKINSQIPAGTDVTARLLKNPDFTSNFVSDPTQGWVKEGDQGSGNWRIDTNAKCGECWNGKSFDVYQIVNDAPVGVYEIQLQGFVRAGGAAAGWGYCFDTSTGKRLNPPAYGSWQPNEAAVYLNDNTGTLASVWDYPHAVDENFYEGLSDMWTDPLGQNQYPNNMPSSGRAFANGDYPVSAFGLIREGDQMRIGIKGNNYSRDNWCIFANFKLIYQAYKVEVVKPKLDEAVAALGDSHIGTELQQEQSVLVSKANAVDPTDGEAQFNILGEIYAFNTKKADSEKEFANLLAESKNLEDAIDKYEQTASQTAKDAATDLYGVVIDAYEGNNGFPSVTTEKVSELIDEIAEAIQNLKVQEGSDDKPADFTDMIANADMASEKGWTDTKENMAVDATNMVAEFFNKSEYNVYQELTGLPAGTYSFDVKGLYRAGEVAEDWPTVVAETESNAIFYVTNDNATIDNAETTIFETGLRHISADAVNDDPKLAGQTSITPFNNDKEEMFDDTKWYIPNTMASAAGFFKRDVYNNTIYVYVNGPKDKIRFGIMRTGEAIKNDWAIFTNWKLLYYGNASSKEAGVQTSSYADPIPTIDEDRSYYRSDLNGALTQAEELKPEVAKVSKEAAETLQTAIDAAKAVYSGTEETPSTSYSNDDIVDATVALYDAIDDAQEVITGISEVGAKANKALANGKYFKKGQLIIVKNGNTFTATGVKINK